MTLCTFLILFRFAKDHTTEEIRNLQQSAAHLAGPPYGVGGFRPSSDMLTRPTVQESHPVGVCSGHPQDEQHGMSQSYATCTCSDTRTPVVLSNQCNSTQHLTRDCACGHIISGSIEEYFTSLSVSSSSSSAHTDLVSGSAPQPQVVMRTCREQAAAAYVNSFDDTTVDDLAGYLDEIMFIPKPMSEMAELMYT